MGANYQIELISIETYAAQFIGHNRIFLGSVYAPCAGSTAYDTPTYYKRAWLHWDKMAQLKLRNLTIPMSWFVNKL